jgi:hypothetical protein
MAIQLCQAVFYLEAAFALVFATILAVVIYRNKLGFSWTHRFICVMFTIIYALLLVTSWEQSRGTDCQVTLADELMVSQANILNTIIIQLFLYRMITMRLRLKDDPNGRQLE